MSARVMLVGGPQHGKVLDHDRAEPPGVTIVMSRIPGDSPMVEDLYLWAPGVAADGTHRALFTGTRPIREPDPESLKPSPDELPGQGPLSAERIAVIEKVAELWRGDWSGREFDGKDGSWWLRTALHGSDEELAEVQERLKEVEDGY